MAGISAAIEAKKAGLNFAVFEATEIFSTVVNFPKGKPIYTYPTEMKLDGGLQFTADVKEALVAEMEEQRRAAGIEVASARIERIERRGGELLLHKDDKTTIAARRAIVAIGRSGNFRKLGVPGEELDKVYNRLFDPHEFAGQDALVVGGGDSALETAIALTTCGARVTLSYRRKELARAKPANIEKIEMLVRDASADVQIEKPTSERVNTALTSGMREPDIHRLAQTCARHASNANRAEAGLPEERDGGGTAERRRLHHVGPGGSAGFLSAFGHPDRGRGDVRRLERARSFPRLLRFHLFLEIGRFRGDLAESVSGKHAGGFQLVRRLVPGAGRGSFHASSGRSQSRSNRAPFITPLFTASASFCSASRAFAGAKRPMSPCRRVC